MRKILVNNSFWIAIAFFCAARMSDAQGVDAAIQNPFLARNGLSNIGPDADGHLTLGGEYKQAKNVVEQQKPVCWTWYADIGYETEYNFRGTDLTPNSSGAGFITADVSKWGFTLGLYGIHQFGTAHAGSFSMGEGGGGGGTFLAPNSALGPVFPETIQNQFNELDAFLQYTR